MRRVKDAYRSNFMNSVEANQADHFFRMGNLGMGLGSGTRSVSTNRKTLEQLMRNLDRKRLTLLNLRGGRTVQHVVMAKSYQKSHDGSVSITVYEFESAF